MPDSNQNKKGLRISKLAELAGVSPPTIKHYLHEGLLPKPIKTGKTMSYYDPSCVERIKLIKKLQREKFLPLEMIRRIIDSGEVEGEEHEIGVILAKSDKLDPDSDPVTRDQVEERTGLSIKKINELEKKGLIFPTSGPGGKTYDSLDQKIIAIAKRREELGLPSEYSLETMILYRDAIKKAVLEDTRRFTAEILGKVPTDQALSLMREADDDLDRFVVMIRQKMMSAVGRDAIREMNGLKKSMLSMGFLPLRGSFPPDSYPKNVFNKILYHFCEGSFETVLTLLENIEDKRGLYFPAHVLAFLLTGKFEKALELTDKTKSDPGKDRLSAAAAALACLSVAVRTSGFSGPMYLVKQAQGYLERAEEIAGRPGTVDLLFRYVCGSIYALLPEVYGMREKGLVILAELETDLIKGAAVKGRLPAWFVAALEIEIYPEAIKKIRGLLAAQADNEE